MRIHQIFHNFEKRRRHTFVTDYELHNIHIDIGVNFLQSPNLMAEIESKDIKLHRNLRDNNLSSPFLLFMFLGLNGYTIEKTF